MEQLVLFSALTQSSSCFRSEPETALVDLSEPSFSVAPQLGLKLRTKHRKTPGKPRKDATSGWLIISLTVCVVAVMHLQFLVGFV